MTPSPASNALAANARRDGVGGIAGGAVWAGVARADDLVVHGVEDAAEDVGGGGSAGATRRDRPRLATAMATRGERGVGDLRELVLDERGTGRHHAWMPFRGPRRRPRRGARRRRAGERGATVAGRRRRASGGHRSAPRETRARGLIPTNARAPRVGGYLSQWARIATGGGERKAREDDRLRVGGRRTCYFTSHRRQRRGRRQPRRTCRSRR